MLLESVVSIIIFVVVGISMSNFIISGVKYITSNNRISRNLLKMRELEVFLNSEFTEYAFDFNLKSNKVLTYKKIVPIDSKRCEVKKREIIFNNGSISLRYDNRNVTNLLKGVQTFDLYRSNDLIFVKVLMGDIKLTKVISTMSYDI